jgi:FlaG/FlaF family flagellin (archaellin)
MRIRSDTRGVVTVERIAVWVLAILAVAGLAALVVGPGAEYRTATPDVSFEGNYNASTGAVTLTHAGGAELTGQSTTRLSVAVTDADTNATTRLTWANDSTLPVGEGDSFTVDDPTVDSNDDRNVLDGDGSVGFRFQTGDTVEVVWTGRLIGAPNERTTTLRTVTIENTTG